MAHEDEQNAARAGRLQDALDGPLQPGTPISIDDIRKILRDLCEEALSAKQKS